MWAQAPGIQCSELADVAPLGAGLEKLQALTSLKLNFEYCKQLSDKLQKRFNSEESSLAAVGRDRERRSEEGEDRLHSKREALPHRIRAES